MNVTLPPFVPDADKAAGCIEIRMSNFRHYVMNSYKDPTLLMAECNGLQGIPKGHHYYLVKNAWPSSVILFRMLNGIANAVAVVDGITYDDLNDDNNKELAGSLPRGKIASRL